MKIAIHHRKGSFSERWIQYCQENQVDFKLVDAYATDIIYELQDCDFLMWHHLHTNYKDVLAAKNILNTLEQIGIKVFPDFNTGWHFDDKVAQKYLLEAINAPLVPSYIFYDKKTALDWIEQTTFPKVFKLKGGSGSRNVKLAHTKNDAIKFVKKAFSNGFSQFDRFEHLRERFRKFRLGKDTFLGVLKGVYRIFVPTLFAKMSGREKGYAYFQDFIPNNSYDTRVIIVGNRAFAITRGVRQGDFRASGSGDIRYDKEAINIDMIKASFEINNKIKAQSIAFDYVFHENKPLVVEISYGYAIDAYDACPGYWDENLNWNEGTFNPQAWMIEDIINLY
ncbi:RimK family alpha-L-glutamate ligase [Myroides sp. ZB35]|uniref:ATP-grasp domain-containing protein n=1 Tax=Myroides sp. ZB35 TaxID=1458492 RepID=UPI0008F45B7D|nr:hypothetical protein [Myroides sp. ZB35]APA93622.1 hypothetical protein BK054_15590 [Myroides sp. ZB35]